MAFQQDEVRRVEVAGAERCIPPARKADGGAPVERLLRDLALALHATRAIRRAMETGQAPCLADC